MKKLSLLSIIIIIISLQVAAQNVGVNIATPSENLQVDSTIKVGKSATINAATPNRKNLLKFGDGDYVTIGEEQADDKLYMRFGDLILLKSSGSSGSGFIGVGTETPSASLDVNGSFRLRTGAVNGRVLTSDANGNASWQTPASFSLPFTGVDAGSGTSFIVSNTNGAANGISGQSFGSGTGVQGLTSGGRGLYGSANSGTGMEAYSNTGIAGQFTSNSGLAIKTVSGNVEVNGKIKMIDGSQGAGKVLTSDNTGLASWQPLPAGIPSIDISGRRLTNSVNIVNNSPTVIPGWENLEQSGGSNFNAATGVYTIPVTGYYQVNGSILWNPIPVNCTTFLSLVANGTTVIAQNYQPSSNAYGVSCNISVGRRFSAGEQLTFRAFQNSGSTVSLFSGYDGQAFSIAYVHP